MAYSHPYACREADDMEAIMQIDTPLHADHQLDQLSGQFEHWRQTRAHAHERIPTPLWDHAVALTSTLSASRVAKHVRLGGSDLKRQMARRQGAATVPMPSAPGLVEVPPPPAPIPALSSLAVELHRPDGARLRMHSPDASLPLAALVHGFLEAR
jgi:hypothetical protein